MPEEWVSLNQYMKKFRIGYEGVIRLINTGQVEYQKLGKNYRIKVGGDTVSRQLYEQTLERAIIAETKLQSIQAVLN